ncbi:MAG: helix-turn-helix transcriptional regulator [Desulfobacteraceae bacterium]|nr:helix-turn-helix transcriptional regulator [Desulfobacteraceae bacterium]
MEHLELFRVALKSFTDQKNPPQSDIADTLGIGRTQLNDFLKGRKDFSGKRLEEIAKYLSKTFTEMLIIGERILSGEPHPYDMPNIETLIQSPEAAQIYGLSARESKIIEIWRSLPEEHKNELYVLMLERHYYVTKK